MKFTAFLVAASCLTMASHAKETSGKTLSLFNGKDLTGWNGSGYIVKDGAIVCTPQGRNLTTAKAYTHYSFAFEFKLPPGGNNGIGIHYPGKGDPAYTGMEIQVLDNTHPKYKNLKDHQYHGGIYTLQAAKKGHLKPVGEWNQQTITVHGNRLTVTLNGTTINQANLDELQQKFPRHTGVKRRSGHICFCGHGDAVQFRNIRITELADPAKTKDAGAHNKPPRGFKALFNGKNLDGWFGHGTQDPRTLWKMSPAQLKAHKEKTRANIRKHWRVENGVLINDGKGLYLTTNKDYADFALMLEYKTVAKADSGIYLRGCPQVQIWDTTQAGGKWKHGADKGSGGLWNNRKGSPGRDPLKHMDKPFGEWNAMRILMKGQKVTVWLNGEKVVANAVMHNYFDKQNPIFPKGPIQLQTHGGEIRWRNVFIKELK